MRPATAAPAAPPQSSNPVRVRSFAVALFIVGQGYAPISVETDTSGELQYVFPAAAREGRDRYLVGKALLERMQREHRLVEPGDVDQ